MIKQEITLQCNYLGYELTNTVHQKRGARVSVPKHETASLLNCLQIPVFVYPVLK